MTDLTRVLQDFYKFWETADVTLLESCTSRDLKDNDRNPSVKGTDYDAIIGMCQMFNAGLSEVKHTFTEVHEVEKDKYSIRWEASAVHTGELFGVPATNRTVYFNGHDYAKITNGKISEIWHIEQLYQLFAQIQ